jgi:hypothetical protein
MTMTTQAFYWVVVIELLLILLAVLFGRRLP